MANNYHLATTLIFFLTISTLQTLLSELVTQQPLTLKYHHGDLLRGPLTVNLVWYGQFTPSQRSIIVDFIQSLNQKPISPASTPPPLPSVAAWWKTTEKYHNASSSTVVGKQILDEKYSLGKTLKNYHIRYLATKGSSFATKDSSFATKDSSIATKGSSFATKGSRLATKDSSIATKGSSPNSVNVVLTAKDVSVDGFCRSRCGTHGSSSSSSSSSSSLGSARGSAGGAPKAAYAWVGNSETQCPGQCAWPFHQPIYGPQSAPLVAPNGDVGVDGMVINLATVLAGAVTNPFNEGYYQGSAGAPLEAVSACTGIFGSGAYPGYTGRVLVDKNTGGSYNAHGLNGRKYLVPAMWDPKRGVCSTLV